MAADSDGDQQSSNNKINSTLKAVVICEGNLHDPDFQSRLDCLVAKLTTLVEEPADNGKLKVDKVEPWNSVRVTLSIPKEAAVKLRKLAAEGNSALRALGILSVQLEGDTVLSLRLVGQEIVLRTDNSTPAGPSSSASSGLGELTRILSHQQQQQNQQQQQAQLQQGHQSTLPQDSVAGPSKATPPVQPKPIASVASTTATVVNGPLAAEGTVFKSPNTICPMDGKLPAHVPNVVDSNEYPFESMTQARVIQRRENTLGMGSSAVGSGGVAKASLVPGGSHFAAPNPPPPPPPSYQTAIASVKSGPSSTTGSIGTSSAGTVGNVAMTSPLLVNLLQNESAISQIAAGAPKTASIVKQELLISGTGASAVKTSGVTGIASSSSIVVNDNEQNVNSSSGLQKMSCIVTNSNNPVNPVNANSGSTVVTVAQTIATSVTSNSVANTQQTILVNNSNAGVLPMTTGTIVTGQANCANANANLSITTNSSTINNTASNNQNVINVPPSLVTPPMSVPSSHKNVSVQQQQQQQQQQQPRFNLGPSGATVVRPSTQQSLRPQLAGAGIGHPQQELHRPTHPSHQPQQTHSQLSLSRFPIQQNVSFRQPSAPQASHQQQQQQQSQSFNPRWTSPAQSMDSATNSSYQEFTRYQMQYNLSQQQLVKHPQQQGANSGDLLGISDLPDLGKNDLDSILPTLNSADLEDAFLFSGLDLDLEQPLTSAGTLAKAERRWKQQFLINPLTGELEETQVEETEENDEDATKSFPEFHSEMSNSLYSDDDTSCSTGFSKFTSDVSDTERSNTMDGTPSSTFANAATSVLSASLGKLGKPGKLKKDKAKDGTKSSVKNKDKKPREKKLSSLKQVKTKAKIVASESGGESPGSQEKIKLRLKLEKPEAISVSLVHSNPSVGGVGSSSGLTSTKKVQSSQVLGGTPGSLSGMGGVSNPSSVNVGSTILQTSLSSSSLSSSSSSVPVGGSVTPQQLQQSQSQPALGSNFTGTNNSAGISSSSSSSLQTQSPAGEEPRVPPLHISLRGKNSVVIKNSKKDRKKSQSGGEEDSDGNNFQLSRKSSIKRSSHSTDSRLTVVMTSDASIRLKLDESVSSVASGPSSMPSSPNHHNHNSIGSSNTASMNVASAGIKTKSNKTEDLNQSPIASNELSGSDQQHKRTATDIVLSPNGLMCPEKKRRLSTSPNANQPHNDESTVGTGNSSTSSSTSAVNSINEINEFYETLISSTASGPIGSTNVGTLPHSSLLAAATSSAKNLKSSSTNNSINNSAFGKCISNSKNLVKPAQSSPTTSSVSSPGALAAAPNTKSSTQSSKQPSSSSSPSSETANSSKLPEKGDTETVAAGGDADGKDHESNKTDSNTATTTSGTEVSINQRINNTHLHHHNRPPEKADDSPAPTLEQSANQQQPHTISTASGHLLTQGVRGSPGSQAQGEDSGIESMDALSEKSPHQLSHSPQGNEPNKLLRMDSPKDKSLPAAESKESLKHDSSGNNNNNSQTNLDDYNQIEAELAKMEGLNETAKLNGDHTTLMKPKQELDLLDHAALLKYDGSNLSKILDDMDDDELVMSDEAAVKGKSIEVSSSENSNPKQQQDSATALVVKGEEAEDWLANAGNKQQTQQQQQHQQKGEANVILTSNSNNNLTDKTEIKLDTAQLVLDDCCSNREVLSLKSECDSKIVECKTVIKNDPEEAIVSSVKEEQSCNKSNTNNSSNDISSSNSMKVKPVIKSEADEKSKPVEVAAPITKRDVTTDGTAAVVEPKPRHEQPPLYSYSSEKARERRSAANCTTSNPSPVPVVEIIDLDDSGKTIEPETPPPPPDQTQQQQSKEIHSPLSIDIPLHPDSAEHRIRTRASSKLESPLEPPRQSPSVDSPAAERLKNTLKQSTAAPNTPASTAVGGDRLSPKTLPKAGKRKRQGSESSTQSCVSDDILPSRTKKPRKAAAAAAAVTERQKKNVAVRSTQPRRTAATETPSSNTAAATATTTTIEDSSDSDEPLIEIAGKFRNTKLTKPSSSSTTTSSTTCTTTSTTTSSSTYSSSSPTTGGVSTSTVAAATHEKEKNLRNHKASPAGLKTSGTSQHVSTIASTNNVGAGAAANSTSQKSNTHTGRSAAAATHNAATVSSGTHASVVSDEKISTRRSNRMTTSTLSTAAMNSKAKANATQNSSAASGGGGSADNHHRDPTHHHGAVSHHKNNHANHQHSSSGSGTKGSTIAADSGKATGSGANSASAAGHETSPAPITEVRRKTRSAGLETTTEGRRRRVSRDSK